MKKQSKTVLRCPNCGNQNVQFVARKHEYRLSLLLFGIFLLCFPLVFLILPDHCGHHITVSRAVSFMMGFVGVILILVSRHAHTNYKCKHCGHEFSKR